MRRSARAAVESRLAANVEHPDDSPPEQGHVAGIGSHGGDPVQEAPGECRKRSAERASRHMTPNPLGLSLRKLVVEVLPKAHPRVGASVCLSRQLIPRKSVRRLRVHTEQSLSRCSEFHKVVRIPPVRDLGRSWLYVPHLDRVPQELLLKHSTSAEQSGFGRAFWNTKDFGDLSVPEVVHVAEQDRLAIVGRQ